MEKDPGEDGGVELPMRDPRNPGDPVEDGFSRVRRTARQPANRWAWRRSKEDL